MALNVFLIALLEGFWGYFLTFWSLFFVYLRSTFSKCYLDFKINPGWGDAISPPSTGGCHDEESILNCNKWPRFIQGNGSHLSAEGQYSRAWLLWRCAGGVADVLYGGLGVTWSRCSSMIAGFEDGDTSSLRERPSPHAQREDRAASLGPNQLSAVKDGDGLLINTR